MKKHHKKQHKELAQYKAKTQWKLEVKNQAFLKGFIVGLALGAVAKTLGILMKNAIGAVLTDISINTAITGDTSQATKDFFSQVAVDSAEKSRDDIDLNGYFVNAAVEVLESAEKDEKLTDDMDSDTFMAIFTKFKETLKAASQKTTFTQKIKNFCKTVAKSVAKTLFLVAATILCPALGGVIAAVHFTDKILEVIKNALALKESIESCKINAKESKVQDCGQNGIFSGFKVIDIASEFVPMRRNRFNKRVNAQLAKAQQSYNKNYKFFLH